MLGNLDSGTSESFRADTKHERAKDGDRDAAKHRADECADQRLRSAENQTRHGQGAKRGAGHHDQHEGADEPGQPHVGVHAGQRCQEHSSQCSQPRADHEGGQAHFRRIDAQRARQRLVHDDRAGREAKTGSVKQHGETKADDQGRQDHEEPIERVVDTKDIDRSREQVRRELHVTAKQQRDQLTDDDTETPGGEDGIERPPVERPHHKHFGNATEGRADDECDRQR